MIPRQYTIVFPNVEINDLLTTKFSKIPLIMDRINYIEKNDIKHNKILYTDLCCNIKKLKNREKLCNASKKILTFIFKYASLYPAEKKESPAPEDNFKHRKINILLKNEHIIIQELLSNVTEKKQIDILIETMYIVEIFHMEILYEKIAAIIAMKIKDKTPINVYDLLSLSDYK